MKLYLKNLLIDLSLGLQCFYIIHSFIYHKINYRTEPQKNIVTKRFASPTPIKSTVFDLERKQAKAQELRKSLLEEKTEQWKSKAGKVID